MKTLDPSGAPMAFASDAQRRAALEKRLYRHGYSVRLKLLLSRGEAERALKRCGWTPNRNRSSGWIAVGGRWVLRGSCWLTQRKPRNGSLPLAKANKEWKTVLYGLGIEFSGEFYHVDLQGVRWGDVERFCRTVLGLTRDDYEIEYLRAAEVYIVLAAQEAHFLSQRLRAAQEQSGHPPTSIPGEAVPKAKAKEYLLHSHRFPMAVRTRTKMTALLNIYRVAKGSTAPFKAELRLAGKKRERHYFYESDVDRLQSVLLDLVSEHELHPLEKPARWEPRDPSQAAEQCPTDPILERLPAAAYRGKRLRKDHVEKCNTLPAPQWLVCPDKEGKTSGLSCIRNGMTPSSSNSQSESLIPLSANPITSIPSIWTDLASEILSHSGFLSEVILSSNQDPTPLVEALVLRSPTVSIRVMSDGSSSWRTLDELMVQNPEPDESNLLVIVVDPSVLNITEGSLFYFDGERDDATYETVYGPLWPPHWDPAWGVLPVQIHHVAGRLWPLFEEFRTHCEKSGLNVVIITVDARPDHALGVLRRSHFFRDSRFRSIIGDAGRYWSHMRYRVKLDRIGQPTQILLWKDEAEGRTGRIIWDKGWGGPTCRRDSSTDSLSDSHRFADEDGPDLDALLGEVLANPGASCHTD